MAKSLAHSKWKCKYHQPFEKRQNTGGAICQRQYHFSAVESSPQPFLYRVSPG